MQRSYTDLDDDVGVRLRLKAISKSFPGVKALDEVDFDLRIGEVHAICGENGAGKSTLMNILSGNHQPDSGSILLSGEEITISNQMVAQHHRIGIVYQEKSLIGNLSVADNIFAGNQPVNRWNLIDSRKLHNQTQQLLRKLGMSIDSHLMLNQLSPGKQQMVEIAKAMARDPQILILDEPTASISEKDAAVLFKIIRLMARQGKSIIYISHRMPEIFQMSDRVTVLKDGKYQGTRVTQQVTVDEIIRLMVGRSLDAFDYRNTTGTTSALEAENLSGHGFQDISFVVREGEILGFAGLVGAGRTEIAKTIFGVEEKTGGEIKISGNAAIIRNPSEAIDYGIGYVPENRKEQGLFLEMSLTENILSVQINNKPEPVFVKESEFHQTSKSFVQTLGIKTPSLKEKVMNLSGGNQQKVVLAKWLLLNPRVLIVDEPTSGVDVGAKLEIYRVLNELSNAGTAIILISSDLPELLTICDRMLVFCHGTLTAELSRQSFNEEEIMHYSSGTKDMFSKELNGEDDLKKGV